jgi:hydroxymethylglutaryl-CoA lyase
MSKFPSRIHITEEGPREGFQFEKKQIATARKIELIDALSETGLEQIQVTSFVSPKAVPQMADADEVVRGIHLKDGVDYIALWLNLQGFERALATGRLHMEASVSLTASETFLQRNQKRTMAENLEQQRKMAAAYKAAGLKIERGTIMSAFGCNFEGEIPVSRVVSLVQDALDVAKEQGDEINLFNLSDTMGWATPRGIREVVDAVRGKFPQLELSLHLHDTRGMGIANAYAGLELGVTHFDACVGGLGGCPFAGNRAAAGNVCTEDLVFMCNDLGIETGVNIDALIAVAKLAEDIIGHPLPGAVLTGGSLSQRRQKRVRA